MSKRKLDPYTLQSIRRIVSKERTWWSKRVALADNSYGSGFNHGMAEMARRVAEHCRDEAKSLESATRKKAAK